MFSDQIPEFDCFNTDLDSSLLFDQENSAPAYGGNVNCTLDFLSLVGCALPTPHVLESRIFPTLDARLVQQQPLRVFPSLDVQQQAPPPRISKNNKTALDALLTLEQRIMSERPIAELNAYLKRSNFSVAVKQAIKESRRRAKNRRYSEHARAVASQRTVGAKKNVAAEEAHQENLNRQLQETQATTIALHLEAARLDSLFAALSPYALL